jgi:S-adenosylmethionine decarboxylase
MSNYIGKHLLLDCYGCRMDAVKTEEDLKKLAVSIARVAGVTLLSSNFYQNEGEMVLAAFAPNTHVCIHVYTRAQYVAGDIYCFNTKLKPTQAIRVLKAILHPDKLRVTSIRRGNLDNPDMKPKTKSKSTTMRKVRSTGRTINQARKKVAMYIRKKTKKEKK